jgi:FdhD protein
LPRPDRSGLAMTQEVITQRYKRTECHPSIWTVSQEECPIGDQLESAGEQQFLAKFNRNVYNTSYFSMAKIIAVCKSKEKGTRKKAVAEGILKEDYGLVGDAHADCCTHRQVSLLAMESIAKMRKLGFEVGPGDFAENLTTQGVELVSLPVDTKIFIGKDVLLEVTQIGKKCHSSCAIYQEIGKCIMPREGIFARVTHGGRVRAGDPIKIEQADNETETLPILKFTEKGSSRIEDVVAKESSLTIILNNQELATLLCSPANLRYLAVGFLVSEGLLKSKDEIKRIMVDDRRGMARVETERDEELAGNVLSKKIIASGGGRGASAHSAAAAQEKVESQIKISAPEISALSNKFQRRCRIFRATGGVHSAALCDDKDVLVFSEDIGRHNALDKIFGECVLNDITTDDRIIITSGRVSSEILLKVARRNVPIIISKSAPTNLGVRLADALGVTLVGFARGKRMNVYTHDGRITRDGK